MCLIDIALLKYKPNIAHISVHITRNDWLSYEVSYVLVTCKVQHIDKYLEITVHVFQVEILLSVGLIR